MLSTADDDVYEDNHVHAFTRLWINEAECPGLLPYAGETVNVICQLMDNQSSILDAVSKTPDNAFRARICQMELARLSFQLSAYHRCRLLKIINNAYYYSQYQRALLSVAETAFLDAFRGSFEEEVREITLDGIPEQERLFPDKSVLAGSALSGESIADCHPDDNRHIVVRVLRAAEQTIIDPMKPHELHDLIPDDIILLQYKNAKKLLLDELAECI